MSATTADTGRRSSPLLDRLAPLPPPVSPASGGRVIVGVAIGLTIACP